MLTDAELRRLLGAGGLEELGTLLREADYRASAIAALLDGVAPASLVTEPALLSLLTADTLGRREDSLAALAVLLWLQAPLDAARFARAVPVRLRRLLGTLGLVREDAGVVSARVSITEHGGMAFLSDPLFRLIPERGIELCDGPQTVMPFHVSSLELLNEIGPALPQGSLLDVGCGSGCLTMLLAGAGGAATGVDLSGRAVAFARANAVVNASQARFEVADATALAMARYGRIVFNVPSLLHYDGATGFGVEELRRFMQRLPVLLARDGECLMFVVWPVPRGGLRPDGLLPDGLAQGLRLEIRAIEGSAFTLTREDLAAGPVPHGHFLLRRPEDGPRLTRFLAERGCEAVQPLLVRATRR